MPYIKPEDRAPLDDALRPVETFIADYGITPGDLNFLMTRLAMMYVARKGKSYTHLNDVLGALSGAHAEFYRRVVVPYETEKMRLNGDVYEEDP